MYGKIELARAAINPMLLDSIEPSVQIARWFICK